MVHPEILTFDKLIEFSGLVHGVFSRAGGKSCGAFSGLNIGMGCGDQVSIVVENRRLMLASLGLRRAVFLNQVHGHDILVLKQGQDIGNLIWDADAGQAGQHVQADGVITDVKNLGLVIQIADCQAIVLFDPLKGVIGNVHAGWRGSVADIAGKCVRAMVDEFGCRPKDIIAGISPSLGPCCAEFINYQAELPEVFRQYRTGQGKCFDFWAITRDQLVARGMAQENINVMQLCTRCRPDRFFSYRAHKTTGRFGTVIALKK